MEGDAGTSRLNPTDGQERSDTGYVTDGQERSDTGYVTDGQGDESDPHPVETQDQPSEAAAQDGADDDAIVPLADDGPPRRAERFGTGWLVGICAVLLILTAGVASGGYVALRAHQQSAAVASQDELALQRAKECVSATQAPDVAAITASQSKIIECSTGDFAVQANFFTSMLVEAYQAANVAVQVSDLRSAVENHNDDGSVDVLVAVRVKVTNSQSADQEQGYRLRVKMAPADGTYKIAKLDQVTS